MQTDNWQRVEEVFERMRAAPLAERAALLDQECGSDVALRAEVLSLLTHNAQADVGFLESPAARLRPTPTQTRSAAAPPRAPPIWSETLIGHKVGQYRVIRLIGYGGMGCVFEALQERPERMVALKVLPPGAGTAAALARFRQEPELLARLRHPNVAQVYEAGVHRDPSGVELPYFAMEYVPEGQPLNTYAHARQLDLRERVELFAKVCDAVHHGHQKGIIHRDLKPANVLVGADGEPKVIDFGVARVSDADILLTTRRTHAGDLVGTVAYMSPEQCNGDPTGIDARSDIYSLGVVLYELLTGGSPYETRGTTIYRAIRIIHDEPPRPPSQFNRRLRGNLEAVVLKALEKSPARRYASAAGLAGDLRRHLSGDVVEARPPTAASRLLRWALRHPLLVAGICALLMLISSATLSVTLYWLAIMRPHQVRISANSDHVRLETATGYPLHQWAGRGSNSIRSALFVPAPAAPSRGPVAMVGYTARPDAAQPGCVALYDVARDFRRPYMELRIKTDETPEPLSLRHLQPGSRSYAGGDFDPARLLLADVFDDPDGRQEPELIVIFQHHAVTQTAICVYSLDGRLRYRTWIDAQISALHWLPGPRLLVCAGVNGECDYNLSPDYDVPRTLHPQVVFALRLVDGFISRAYVAQQVAAREAVSEVLRPAWYYCVLPLERRAQVGGAPPEESLYGGATGTDPAEYVDFTIRVYPTAKGRGEYLYKSPAGRGWFIRGRDGAVGDHPRGDEYHRLEQYNENADGPSLPPFDTWKLGELPPMPADCVPSSHPPLGR